MRSEPNQPEEGMPLASWLCLGEGQEATWPPRTVQQPLPEQCAIQVATGVRAVSSGKERAQREASRAAFAPHCSLCTFALSGPLGRGRAQIANSRSFLPLWREGGENRMGSGAGRKTHIVKPAGS